MLGGAADYRRGSTVIVADHVDNLGHPRIDVVYRSGDFFCPDHTLMGILKNEYFRSR